MVKRGKKLLIKRFVRRIQLSQKVLAKNTCRQKTFCVIIQIECYDFYLNKEILMKSNNLLTMILLGGMFSSGVSFGSGEGEKTEQTRFEKLINYLDKHKNKVALTALVGFMANRLFVTDPTMPPIIGFYTRNSPFEQALRSSAYFAAEELGIVPEIVKQDPTLAAAIAAVVVLSGYMYLSSSAKGWLEGPGFKEHSIDKQIYILESIYKNMSYPRYLMGGAIGLQEAIRYLKAEKEKEVAAQQ